MATTITKRTGLGRPLTAAEMDANLQDIVDEKVERDGSIAMTGRLSTPGVDASVNFTGDLVGDVTGTVSDISNHDTGDLTEGSNLYYTTARANTDFDTRLATKDTGDLTEGANLYYTNARADARIAAASITDLSDADQGVATTDSPTFVAVNADLNGDVIGDVLNTAGDTVLVDSSAAEIVGTVNSSLVTGQDITVTNLLRLPILNAEPGAPITEGTVAIADGDAVSGWDPLTNGVQSMVVYLDGAWRQIAVATP